MSDSLLRVAIQNVLEDLSFPATPIELEHPSELVNGDYSSNIGFLLSKQIGGRPQDIAEQVASRIPYINFIKKVEVAHPGFINFFLTDDFFFDTIDTIISNPKTWGQGDAFNGEHHLIEHSSPNLFKPFHIGHLVNNAIGESIVRLTESQGAKVTRLSWPSDVSPGIAKAVWGLVDMGRENDFSTDDLGEAYVRGIKAYEDSQEAKLLIDEINRQIYTKTPGKYLSIYERGKDISVKYFSEITKRLGSRFDRLLYESEAEPVGVAIVREHCQDVFEESEGAIIYRGSQDGLYDSVFINSQGFGTYLAKDIGLIDMKKRDFNFTRSITVTDIQQKSHFDLVVSAMKKLDSKTIENIYYIQHGRLRFAGTKISSRLGNVPLAASIIEEVKGTLSQSAASQLPEGTLEKVAIAAIKYAILRVNPGKNMVFNPEQSLSLEGSSGLYLEYTYARAMAVLSKAPQTLKRAAPRKLSESNLERLLYRFPEIVKRAALSYEPHHLVQYVTSICAEFNRWYAAEQILDREDSATRIALVRAVAITISNALNLLGIESVERV